MKRRLLLVIGTLLFCGLSACMSFRQPPDDVLFNRATDAIESGKYAVARLSLQTLINTYPASEHVPEAKKLLQDSRMPACDGFADCPSMPPSR